MAGPLEFYYDFISPNAYLAWQKLPDIATANERELVLKPVLFAGLLQAHRQAGPAEVRPKMQWMVRNCLRKAKDLAIPLAPPHSHPFNPLLVLRLALAADGGDRERLTDVLFRAVWAESRDVTDIETVRSLLDGQGFDANRLLGAALSDVCKAQLRAETEAAVANGVFGVPAMTVDDQLFFGFDDLCWLERYLRGEDPVAEQDYGPWRAVRPSAWRTKQ